MSNLTVRGNTLGTGTFIVESPNSNTSRTITLPDQTATLATTVDSITQTQLATALNVTGTAPMFACRAWVNFNGTGTVSTNQTIRGSGNVASVFKNATGDYTITFTTAMPTANYAAQISVDNSSVLTATSAITYATASVRIALGRSNTGAAQDSSQVNVAIFC